MTTASKGQHRTRDVNRTGLGKKSTSLGQRKPDGLTLRKDLTYLASVMNGRGVTLQC